MIFFPFSNSQHGQQQHGRLQSICGLRKHLPTFLLATGSVMSICLNNSTIVCPVVPATVYLSAVLLWLIYISSIETKNADKKNIVSAARKSWSHGMKKCFLALVDERCLTVMIRQNKMYTSESYNLCRKGCFNPPTRCTISAFSCEMAKVKAREFIHLAPQFVPMWLCLNGLFKTPANIESYRYLGTNSLVRLEMLVL